MAGDNLTWGEERIAHELLLKFDRRVSPRPVRKYMPHHVDRRPGTRVQVQRWRTFVRNHAQAIVACDFCVAITVTFHMLYVLVIDDIIVQAAELYAVLYQAGQLISDADILIAATALKHTLVMVAENVHHFRRIPRLASESWRVWGTTYSVR